MRGGDEGWGMMALGLGPECGVLGPPASLGFAVFGLEGPRVYRLVLGIQGVWLIIQDL